MQSLDHLKKNHPCFGGCAFNAGRIHLPVSPGCNIACAFCDRQINEDEERPGVTRRVITPDEAVTFIGRALELCPSIKVAGIAGPGDTLATDKALETFRKLGERYPELLKCMSTNGLLLYEKADELIETGIDTLTVTVNAVDPEIEAQLNEYVIWHGEKIEGVPGAKILIENQLKGIRKIAAAGVTIKVNTVLVPGINDGGVEGIARKAAELGASVQNIMPLIPAGRLSGLKAPDRREVRALQDRLDPVIRQFRSCAGCRADACGLLSEGAGQSGCIK